jgi:hypothetical protein
LPAVLAVLAVLAVPAAAAGRTYNNPSSPESKDRRQQTFAYLPCTPEALLLIVQKTATSHQLPPLGPTESPS